MFGFGILCTVIASAATAAPTKPHIVFFLADDYGFADASYHAAMYGNSSNVVNTPAIDALAHSGIRLENYYVQPVCSPTRATIMTGRYVIHTGIHTAFMDSSTSVLGIEEVTLADKMREANYATEMVGKWHLGFRSWKYTPVERGFDNWFGYFAGSTDYWNHESLCWPGGVENGCFENTTKDGNPTTGLDLHRNRESIHNNTEYSTVLFTEEANRVIEKHARTYTDQDKSLFLYLPYQAVHVGNAPEADHPSYGLDQAPQWAIDEYSWVEAESRRNLSGMITVMDQAVLNVTTSLKKNGLWESTLFIFSTDNGGPVSQGASNYPLKQGKGTYWEGGLRGVGFIASGSFENIGINPNLAGSINKALIHVSDWLPTLCDVAGCGLNGTLPLDGVSAWNAIANNGTSKRNTIIHDICWTTMGGSCAEKGHNRVSIRYGDFKYLLGESGQSSEPELFNVVEDVGETTNLADKHPDIMKIVEETIIKKYNATLVPAADRDPIDPNCDPQKHGGEWVPWMDN